MISIKRLIAVAAGIAAGAYLSGCGRDHNTGLESTVALGIPNGTWSKTGVDRNELAGAWRSDCKLNGANSIKIEARIFDDRTLIISYYFSDNGCENQDYESVVVLKSLPTRSSDDGRDFDLDAHAAQIRDVMMVPSSERTAQSMQKTRSCGSGDWKYNQARSIYDTACFSKRGEYGTIHFFRSEDEGLIQVKFPGAAHGVWLRNRG